MKKSKILLIGVIFSFLLTAVAVCGQQTDNAEKYLREGAEFENSSNFDRALKSYEEALKLDQGNLTAIAGINSVIKKQADFYLEFGKLYEEEGEREKAIEYYKKAVETNPNNITAKDTLENALSKQQFERFFGEPLFKIAILVLVIAIIIGRCPYVRKWLNKRRKKKTTIEPFGNFPVEKNRSIDQGKMLSQLVIEKLHEKDRGVYAPKITEPTPLLPPEAPEKLRIISGFIRWLFPPNITKVTGRYQESNKNEEKGTTVQLINTQTNKIESVKTLWEEDYARTHLFNIDVGLKDELDQNKNVSEKLKIEFESKGFPLSINATITKEKENEWVITDEEKFIARKEEGKLNIYARTKERGWEPLAEAVAYWILFCESEDKPKYFQSFYDVQKGDQRFSIEDFDKALNYYKKAIESEKDYAKAYHNMGYVFEIQKRYAKAIGYYNRAIDFGYKNRYLTYSNLGNVYRDRYWKENNKKKDKPFSLNWDTVDRNDLEKKKLLKFLKDDFDIDWAENAEISKSSDKNISISENENSAKITIDEKKEKATITISDGRTYNLKVKKEKCQLSICKDDYLEESCTSFDNAIKSIPDNDPNKGIKESKANVAKACTYLLMNSGEQKKAKRIIDREEYRISPIIKLGEKKIEKIKGPSIVYLLANYYSLASGIFKTDTQKYVEKSIKYLKEAIRREKYLRVMATKGDPDFKDIEQKGEFKKLLLE